MGLNTYIAMASIASAMIPSKDDWDRKANECIELYKHTYNLPRKLKKKKRKELNHNYNFYLSMKDYKPFDF